MSIEKTPTQRFATQRAMEADLLEMNRITKKPKHTREDVNRLTYLNTRIAALRSGYTPEDIAESEVHMREARAGEPLTSFEHSEHSEQTLAEARAFQQFVRTGKVEQRVGEVGSPLINTTGIGGFVPPQWLNELWLSLRQHDPIFDPEVCTLVTTGRGGLMQIPLGSDLGNVAQPLAESADETPNDVDMTSTNHAETHPKTYRSPRFIVSTEAWQDVGASFTIAGLFQRLAADRIARGVGRDLLKGSGGNAILGLIPQLQAAGDVATVAKGSAANDGSGNTGSNSLGVADLAACYTSVDQAYRASPKACWFLNDNTLNFLIGSLVDKMGHPIVKMCEGLPTLFGKPVLISPSMDDIGPSKIPVLFGDMSYFLVHNVGPSYIARYQETIGLIEKGNCALRVWSRWDGKLLWADAANSKSPIHQLQCSS